MRMRDENFDLGVTWSVNGSKCDGQEGADELQAARNIAFRVQTKIRRNEGNDILSSAVRCLNILHL